MSSPTSGQFPSLDGSEIQADPLVGIQQRHEWLLLFRFEDSHAFRRALASIAPCVTSARAALEMRLQGMALGCCNLGLSYGGLRKLRNDSREFRVKSAFRRPQGTNLFSGYRPAPANAFAEDCASRSHLLGDPRDDLANPGHPRQWVVGGALPSTWVDGIMLLSAPTLSEISELSQESVDRLRGAEIVRIERGLHLPQGREHFGYVDGISQPSIAATIDGHHRLWQPTDPQRWCEPGEFFLGHERPKSLEPVPAPGWAKDGTFLVFRRLRQNVGAFHQWIRELAAARRLDPLHLAAMVCGRWPDGAPLHGKATTANSDPAATHQNDFDFSDDPAGAACPLTAHVRKCNPRVPFTAEPIGTQLDHAAPALPPRIIRRGIPYGEPSTSTWEHPVFDGVDRGLLFVCYQARIEEQFELITRGWMNNIHFPSRAVGHDLLVGRHTGGSDARSRPPGHDAPLLAREDFVVPTGGGYFFCPSTSGLHLLAHGPS